MDQNFEKWLQKQNAEDLMWVIEMAKVGIRATEGAGDHPANVFLYGMECDCKQFIEENYKK